MSARPSRLPGAAPVPRIVLLRRRQQVVVRAPSSTEKAVVRPPRPVSKTLPGLGASELAFREKADTIPAVRRAVSVDETPPTSGVRLRAPEPSRLSLEDLTPRPRPVTLIDGVHDGLSQNYLAEAKRLLESGIFSRGDSDADLDPPG